MHILCTEPLIRSSICLKSCANYHQLVLERDWNSHGAVERGSTLVLNRHGFITVRGTLHRIRELSIHILKPNSHSFLFFVFVQIKTFATYVVFHKHILKILVNGLFMN